MNKNIFCLITVVVIILLIDLVFNISKPLFRVSEGFSDDDDDTKHILSIESHFLRGYVVSVNNQKGKEIARGIVRYKSADIEKIKGQHSDKIEEILGYEHGTVVIHRDDLVIL